jgi:hypothetical protein
VKNKKIKLTCKECGVRVIQNKSTGNLHRPCAHKDAGVVAHCTATVSGEATFEGK